VLTTLRIDPDAPQDWAWDGMRYTALGGVIEPYAHPMTEHAAVTDGTRTTVILRERTRHRPGLRPELARVASRELDQVTAMARQWPGDYLLIEAERYRPVRVTAGAARTTPLYLAHSGGVLHGSWDMGWLRQFAAGLNPKEATRMLAYHPRYSYETAFTGIWRLTERAAATFGGDLYVRYPEPVPHATPRELADSADVLTAFAQAIDAALDLRPLDPGTTTFHLTGGLDSGSIAARAARRHPGALNTATLVITGPGREHQLRRRSEILSRLPFGPRDRAKPRQVARAALPYGDDQIAPPAMAGGITLLAAECVAPPLLRRSTRSPSRPWSPSATSSLPLAGTEATPAPPPGHLRPVRRR
jgi:asparagine synthase (glutamine-hydrolysing)